MRRHWLLTVEIAGQVHRYSVDDVEVTDADGVTYLYRGGLSDLAVSESLTDGPPSVAVSILDQSAGWAARVAAGGWLDGGEAELALWTEGDALEESLWVAGGIVTAPEYGTDEEPLTFSIEARPVKRMFPPPSASIGTDTWPVTAGLLLNARTVGWSYPWVFGEPGKVGGVPDFQGGVVNELLQFDGVPSTPGYVAEYSLINGKGANPPAYLDNAIIVAGHKVSATHVVVWTGSDSQHIWRFPVYEVEDGSGRTVTVTKSSAHWCIEPTGEYWCGWDSGGGLDITGAGSVLRYMLEEAGETIDSGRWATGAAALDAYRLDFAIAEPVDPHEWASSHLGALLPLARRYGRHGVWYEIVPWATAGPADVVAYLDGSREPEQGTQVTREGAIGWSSVGEVVTRAELRYRRWGGSRYARTIRSDASGTYASALAERSAVGVREWSGTCDVVDDDATAGAMLAAFLAWRSTPRRQIVVTGGGELIDLEVGSVVAYTETEASLDREIAIITERTITPEEVRMLLVLVERPTLAGWAS